MEGMVSSGFVEGEEEEEVRASSLESQWASEVNRILKPGRYLIVISCNHSKQEITKLLEGEQMMQLIQDESDKYDDLRYLVFQKPSSSVGS